MSKLKVGILTLPLNTNYGGILQAYALQKSLIKNGFETVLIDRQWNKSVLDKIKILIKKLFFRKRYNDTFLIKAKTNYFITNYVTPKTKEISSNAILKKVVENEKLDAIIVGSDQVWRLEYTKAFSSNYFLDFLRNNKSIKKLSYAASFGEDVWTHSKQKTDEIYKLINEFDCISVREDSGVKICKDNFNVVANHNIDPTMLLSKEDYESLVIEEREPKREGNVLVYMLDINSDRQKTIDTISHYIGGTPFSVNVKSVNPDHKIQDRIYPSVTSWLKGFKDAKFVITDSFHGSIFSIIFNKPFVAYGNVRRGLSRFHSLFRMFGLENRFILKHSDLDISLLSEDIDWERINSKLRTFRSNSEEYFKRNI